MPRNPIQTGSKMTQTPNRRSGGPGMDIRTFLWREILPTDWTSDPSQYNAKDDMYEHLSQLGLAQYEGIFIDEGFDRWEPFWT